MGSPPKVNVIPSASEATLDCRLLPGVNPEEFLAAMKARINDPRVTLEVISTPDDPGASAYGTPLFEAIREAIVKNYPGALVTPMLVPHGTDSVKLRKEGVIAYGLTPMVLDLATAGSMHGGRVPDGHPRLLRSAKVGLVNRTLISQAGYRAVETGRGSCYL